MVILRQLENYLEKLSNILAPDLDEYLISLQNRLATERLLQLAIECIIDVCAILAKDLHLGPPQNEDNLLELLSGKLTNVEILKQMKRFRNILVHRYGEIDDRLVYQFASEQTSDFEQFIQEVEEIIKNLEKIQ